VIVGVVGSTVAVRGHVIAAAVATTVAVAVSAVATVAVAWVSLHRFALVALDLYGFFGWVLWGNQENWCLLLAEEKTKKNSRVFG
jgi:hypothetical protein